MRKTRAQWIKGGKFGMFNAFLGFIGQGPTGWHDGWHPAPADRNVGNDRPAAQIIAPAAGSMTFP
jgi:hypothetical protein